MKAEITKVFDYSPYSDKATALIVNHLERMKQLYRQTVYTALDIGLLLLEVKKTLLEEKTYGFWLDSEFPWGRSSANQFENVALRFVNVQNLDRFDVTALYVLAAPSTPDEIRSQAIALANQGEHISHRRAKALKEGLDIPTLRPGKQVVVQNGIYEGQTVTVKGGDKQGLITVTSKEGEKTLLVSELVAADQPKATKPKIQTTSHIEAIAVELEIESDRVKLLEEMLGRIIAAARKHQLTELMLLEAESML